MTCPWCTYELRTGRLLYLCSLCRYQESQRAKGEPEWVRRAREHGLPTKDLTGASR
jgi:hypothetical protein